MRFLLHTVICCWVFTTVVPLGDHGPQKKRFKEWLQSHMSTTPSTQLSAARAQTSGGSSHTEDGETSLKSASFRGNIRSKRSPGCALSTCIIHDVEKFIPRRMPPRPCAPKNKLGKDGYGRRRRMADNPQLTLQAEGPRTSTEATQQDGSNQTLCFNAVEKTPHSAE